MKILLAPSESKVDGGVGEFQLDKLLFKELLSTRREIIDEYHKIVSTKDLDILKKLFGLKKESDIARYTHHIDKLPTLKAIERYSGVVYKYLDYKTLSSGQKSFLDSNVIIFSNLFGFLRADDMIPTYRLKQKESINSIEVDKVYKKHSYLLDEYLKDEEILDLRALYYENFYKIRKPYTTLKFIKDGKVVSHWAKAYRGIVLRDIAKKGISSLDEFYKSNIYGLSIVEILQHKYKTEIIYNIEES